MDGAEDVDGGVEAAMSSSAATSSTLYAQGDQSGVELHFHRWRPRRGRWRGGCHLHTCGAKHDDDDVRAETAGLQLGVTSTSVADDAEDDDHDSGVKAASVQPDVSSTPAADDAQDGDHDGSAEAVDMQPGAPSTPAALKTMTGHKSCPRAALRRLPSHGTEGNGGEARAVFTPV
jgi:hypothetical protein